MVCWDMKALAEYIHFMFSFSGFMIIIGTDYCFIQRTECPRRLSAPCSKTFPWILFI